MKYVSYILIFMLIALPVTAMPRKYQEVVVTNISHQQIIRLTQEGLIIDNIYKNTAHLFLSSDQFRILDAMGLDYAVKQAPSLRDRDNYPSFDEITVRLKNLAKNHPDICQLYNIGLSVENHPLWFVKISDNVTHEEDEPEVKYISSMHGDEPLGMFFCLNFMDRLLENYGKDERMTNFVNTMEIWVMPLMNPDGYVHHQRENRQGYDLNREFPDRVDDNNNTTSGRPIEVQHVMNLEFKHSSILSANLHGGTMVVNYPYDSDFNPSARYSATPDDTLFREMALSYSLNNPSMKNSTDFDLGITNGVDWYFVYGGMQDWSYVWMGCMEVTIELWDDKWPPYSQIPDLWMDNQASMFKYIEWALKGVRGLVTDKIRGIPLKATVCVKNIDFNVYTDPDVGDYHRILLPGTYDIQYSAPGYISKTIKSVQVTDGDAIRVDVQLMPMEPVFELSDIIRMLRGLSGFVEHVSFLDIDQDEHFNLADVICGIRVVSD